MAKKKAKLPKRIAGVKIPKKLRKQGGSLLTLVDSPTGRQLVADALIAVAGVLAGNERSRRAVAQAGSETAEAVGGAAKDTGAAVRDVAEVATDVVAGAAKSLLTSTLGGGKDKRSDEDVVRHVSRRDSKRQDDKPHKH